MAVTTKDDVTLWWAADGAGAPPLLEEMADDAVDVLDAAELLAAANPVS
jgi:hypothetical protein